MSTAPAFSIHEPGKWVTYLQSESASSDKRLMQARSRRDLYFGCFLAALVLTVVTATLTIFRHLKTSPYIVSGAGSLTTGFLALKYRTWSWKYYSGSSSLAGDLAANLVPILENKAISQDSKNRQVFFMPFAAKIEDMIGKKTLTVSQLGLIYCFFQQIGHTNMYEYNDDEIELNQHDEDLKFNWTLLLSELKITTPSSYPADIAFLKTLRPAMTSYPESQKNLIVLTKKCRG